MPGDAGPRRGRATAGSRVRNAVLTIWNLSSPCTVWAESAKPACLRYFVFQTERCPSTARDHIQAYAEFDRPMSMRSLRVLFDDPSLHVEKRRGTASEASLYCKKLASRVDGPAGEFGTISSPGARTDLAAATGLVLERGLAAVRSEQPSMYVRYFAGLARLNLMHALDSGEKRSVSVHVLCGPPGTGKSWAARCLIPDSTYCLQHSGGSTWFDGYEDHECLVIDEMCGSTLSYTFLLQLLDVYAVRLPVKGGFVPGRFSQVVITCNRPPVSWYECFQGDLLSPAYMALRRRLKYLVEYHSTFHVNNRKEYTEMLLHFGMNPDVVKADSTLEQ